MKRQTSTITCTRKGCGAADTTSLDAVTVEEAEAMHARDLNAAGWQVSRTAGTLCPAHRPGPGVSHP